LEKNYNEQFVSLLLSHHRRIYGFILTLVPSLSDADDIMQETALVMCRKFDDFQPGTSFIAWALAIARNRVIMYKRKNKSLLQAFDDNTLTMLAKYAAPGIENMDERVSAVESCIDKLKEKDRQLIKNRYEQGSKIKDIAINIGRSPQVMYKTFARIHNSIRLCVQQAIKASGT